MSYNDNNGYNNYGSYNDPMYNQNNYGSYNDPMYNQNNYGSYNNTMYNQNNYGGYDSYQQSVTNARVAQYNAQYSDVDYNSHEISFQKYNLIIGAVLLYGFLVNAFMVAFCADSLINFIYYNPAMFYISYFVLAIVGGLIWDCFCRGEPPHDGSPHGQRDNPGRPERLPA